jgi:hypothetical protein
LIKVVTVAKETIEAMPTGHSKKIVLRGVHDKCDWNVVGHFDERLICLGTIFPLHHNIPRGSLVTSIGQLQWSLMSNKTSKFEMIFDTSICRKVSLLGFDLIIEFIIQNDLVSILFVNL